MRVQAVCYRATWEIVCEPQGLWCHGPMPNNLDDKAVALKFEAALCAARKAESKAAAERIMDEYLYRYSRTCKKCGRESLSVWCGYCEQPKNSQIGRGS